MSIQLNIFGDLVENTKHPVLYKKTTTGAQQQWKIWTEGSVIHTEWGQTGGKLQKGEEVISEGKNIGKANETCSVEQAQLEAQSKWEKKKKRGYVEHVGAAMAGKVDALITGGIEPMLAHRYDKQGHKITWPAAAQPKLDGHRCIVILEDGKATMWTRTRKPILGVPHIAAHIESLGLTGKHIFDGELYNHAYKENFEDLTSFIRQQVPKAGHEVVEYHIYDYPSKEGGFKERHEALGVFKDKAPGPLCFVETIWVEDEEGLLKAFRSYLKKGYEGAMVRNLAGAYKHSRSYDLLKVKEFDDAEFEVIGVEEGKGKLAGHAIFVMQIDNPEQSTFAAKMKGSTDDLRQYWDNPELAIGRTVTVQFQGYTKYGIPRFPVVLRFRDD